MDGKLFDQPSQPAVRTATLARDSQACPADSLSLLQTRASNVFNLSHDRETNSSIASGPADGKF
jgi:hypothetical protein